MSCSGCRSPASTATPPPSATMPPGRWAGVQGAGSEHSRACAVMICSARASSLVWRSQEECRCGSVGRRVGNHAVKFPSGVKLPWCGEISEEVVPGSDRGAAGAGVRGDVEGERGCAEQHRPIDVSESARGSGCAGHGQRPAGGGRADERVPGQQQFRPQRGLDGLQPRSASGRRLPEVTRAGP